MLRVIKSKLNKIQICIVFLLKSVNTLLKDKANFVIVSELRHKIQNL